MPLLSLSVAQLLLAFVSASILHRLTFNRFFIRWLASHKFFCYLVPSNNELRKLNDRETSHVDRGKKGKHKNRNTKRSPTTGDDKKNQVFQIPTANLAYLKLDKTMLDLRDFETITCSMDLEWIVDLALMSLFSFTITEVQFYFYPQTTESNFSILWALLVIMYCVKILWKLTVAYFRSEKSIGERSICIISACIFLVIAMVVLITDESLLEFGLESAYRSFNNSATAFVNTHSLSSKESRPSTRPISFILVKFTIAIFCSLVGMILTFPGLRFGQLHKALLETPGTSGLSLLLCNFNYLSPLFIVCLWIKPLTRNLFTREDALSLDDASFDIVRIYCIVFINAARFFLVPRIIATFLASASGRLKRIKCRGGNTSNQEIQVTVSSIYNYLNVVALQYLLPIITCLFAGIMFKTMGGYSWIPDFIFDSTPQDIPSNATVSDALEQLTNDIFQANSSNISSPIELQNNTTKFFSLPTMVDFGEFKRIFSTEVFRGMLGFATWWLHFSWFCTSTAGLIYHRYLLH